MQNKNLDLTLDDLQEDPKKFGLPTFEEFCANPDRWRKRNEDAFNLIDAGSQAMKNQIEKHVYYVAGYKCGSLEIAQKVLMDEYGISAAKDFSDIGVTIELEDSRMGKYIAHVKIDPKKQTKAFKDEELRNKILNPY